jgi:hypothetical protein
MTRAFVAAAGFGGLVALGFVALAIGAAAILFAFLHRGFHVFAIATRLAVFHFALVFAAAARGVLGIFGVGGVMAASLAIFHLHIRHVVVAAALGLRGWGGFGSARRSRRFLGPADQRQGKSEDHSNESEFHKSSFIEVNLKKS